MLPIQLFYSAAATPIVLVKRSQQQLLVNAIGAATGADPAVCREATEFAEQLAGPGPWPLQAFPQELLTVATLLRSLQMALTLHVEQ